MLCFLRSAGFESRPGKWLSWLRFFLLSLQFLHVAVGIKRDLLQYATAAFFVLRKWLQNRRFFPFGVTSAVRKVLFINKYSSCSVVLKCVKCSRGVFVSGRAQSLLDSVLHAYTSRDINIYFRGSFKVEKFGKHRSNPFKYDPPTR